MLWQLNRELKKPRRRRRQKCYKFAYLTMKTIVLHALHVKFLFSLISLQFSFFPRREMTCFAVMSMTRARNDIFSSFSYYLQTADIN